jgi:glycolate oxidase
MTVSGDALASDLRRLIGSDAVITDNESRVRAGTDFITYRGAPAAVVHPTSNFQVIELLRYATKQGVRVVPRGTATNLSGAIAPGQDSMVVDLAGMNRIIEIDPERRRAVVEPGVINADVKVAAASLGMTYAPDPASAPISTIGGNIAENAGGPGCIKHGVTFHHVRELDVVLGAKFGSAAMKDVAGFDAKRLVAGGRGTFGRVHRAILRAVPGRT